MDKVGKLNRVLDEKDGHVVAHEIPHTSVGVELQYIVER